MCMKVHLMKTFQKFRFGQSDKILLYIHFSLKRNMRTKYNSYQLKQQTLSSWENESDTVVYWNGFPRISFMYFLGNTLLKMSCRRLLCIDYANFVLNSRILFHSFFRSLLEIVCIVNRSGQYFKYMCVKYFSKSCTTFEIQLTCISYILKR